MKLGPFARLCLVAGALGAAGGTSCGYRPAYSGESRRTALTVEAAPFLTPHPEAVQAALAGARTELRREGAFSGGRGFPRLFVEVLRVDELAAGIQATTLGRERVPLARASSVGVVARAWVIEREGGAPMRDTGDVRRVETVAQGADPLAARLTFQAATRAAARRAGVAVARRALGLPEPDIEPM